MDHARHLSIALAILLGCTLAAFGQSGLDQALLTDPPEELQPRLGRIAGILIDRCVACHDAQDAQGGYSMSTAGSILIAGESKRPVIGSSVGHEQGSGVVFPKGLGELWDRLITNDPELRMPKDSDGLDAEQIEDIRAWIVTGAKIDGSLDAPLESFLPVKISSEPKLPTYRRAHAVQAIALDSERRTVFTSGYQEVLQWHWQDRFELAGRMPVRGRTISDLQWDNARGILWVASGEPGRIGYVESIPWIESTGALDSKARKTAWVSRDTPLDIATSPSGELLGIGNADGTIVVIDASTNSLRWRMSAHASAVTSIDWSRDGKTLLSSSRDRMAKSFESFDGKMLSSFVDSERTVASIVALDRGAVAFDEAGVARYYPNYATPNAKVLWGGFAQQTHKLVASNQDFFAIDSDWIKHFRVRREETEVPEEPSKDEADKAEKDEKKEPKKKKKKIDFYIDSKDGLRLIDASDPQRRLVPLSMQASAARTEDKQELFLAIGCADGEFFIWSPTSKSQVAGINRP